MQNGFLEAKILVLDALIAISVVTSMFSYQCIELWKICRYTHTVTHPHTTSVFLSPCVCVCVCVCKMVSSQQYPQFKPNISRSILVFFSFPYL